MTLKTLAIGTALTLSGALQAQNSVLHPAPHDIQATGKTITLPAACRLIGAEEAGREAVLKLQTCISPQEKSAYTIYIGEKGDKMMKGKAMKKYARLVPSRPEAYYLAADDQKLVVIGSDERGTYYGVQTLLQLLEDGRLPEVIITDYPDIPFRGVVEGFYGTPWSYADRVSQLKFYGDHKLNTYIYGPKDDPYHSSPNWRLPYPEKEAAQLSELVRIARENKVDFVWAIHPGQDIQWNDADRKLLTDKFEKMYQLGVRSFAVFFDDISGEGTDPVRQAELLNYIDDHFVKAKPDVTPLIMCPTEYNKSWSEPARGYLTTLGTKLNPSIHIMWTGDRVISDITRESLEWINPQLKRPAYIWWNFPVSDYVRDHLLMGEVYGNGSDIKDDMSGFVANPMEHAEASKIAIYCVADYAWNLEKYNSRASWEAAIRYVLPSAPEALQTFASHNSDLGQNGHRYRRVESVDIRPVADRLVAACKQGSYNEEDYNRMLDEFNRVVEAADLLMVNKDNPQLIAEMTPWLYQFKLLGETGAEVLAMLKACEAGGQDLFVRKYNHVKALKERSFLIDQTYNQNPYQPGVKTGTLVLQPFIDALFVEATNRFNTRYGQTLSTETNYCPHKLISDLEQIKHLPLQIKTNRILISPLLEVVKWQPGQSVQIELDKSYPALAVELNLGVKNLEEWGVLEASVDGNKWEKVSLSVRDNVYSASLNKQPVKLIRFTNKSDKQQEVYLRRFMLTIEK